jgi:type II secretory pathway pseudopilin PulG
MTDIRKRSRGFTLLETLAVVGITGFLVATIVNMYIGIMSNSDRATATTREIRVAAAILDRVARDLERAYLLTWEDEDDPLEHPWVFIGENRSGQLGADQIMFTTISHTESGRSDERASNAGMATYSYWLEGNVDETYDLVRLVHPRLPEYHAFPNGDEPGALVVAEGLGAFSLRFMDETGSWLDTWDSSTLLDSDQLPLAVEIRLGFLPPIDEGEADPFADEPEFQEYRRRVVLFQRPVSSSEALGGGANAPGAAVDEEGNLLDVVWQDVEEGCDSGVSWDQCLERQSKATMDSLSPAERAAWDKRRGKCVPPASMGVTSAKLNLGLCR